MKLENGEIFHCYNRGNNKRNIFFNEENYLFFLRKLRKHLLPFAEVLAYCLMPNHFHFLIYVNEEVELEELMNNWRIMLSSYTRAINKANDWTGSLFQQKTKFKKVETDDQGRICFNYIHQNPVNANLVEKMESWSYSSYLDYLGIRSGTLINRELAISKLDLPANPDELERLLNEMIPNNYREIVF